MLSQYEEDGYVIVKKFLDNEKCNKFLNLIKTLDPIISVPYSNQPWGFGNLIANPSVQQIVNLSDIKALCERLIGSTVAPNHLMVNHKPAFIGPDVEFHQEIFNKDTFAPGVDDQTVSENWVQAYLPLTDEEQANGGLAIVTRTHKCGRLPDEDIVNVNYSHKRRVPYDSMRALLADESHTIKWLNLDAGDLILFSPLLVHGSSSNLSHQDRSSIVMQWRPETFKRDEEAFARDIKYRTNFIVSSLRAAVAKFGDQRRYKDFKN